MCITNAPLKYFDFLKDLVKIHGKRINGYRRALMSAFQVKTIYFLCHSSVGLVPSFVPKILHRVFVPKRLLKGLEHHNELCIIIIMKFCCNRLFTGFKDAYGDATSNTKFREFLYARENIYAIFIQYFRSYNVLFSPPCIVFCISILLNWLCHGW